LDGKAQTKPGREPQAACPVRTPASNVDLAPTLLALMNLDKDLDVSRFDGRC
jgi:arylsulfatase A-like enzyme